MTDVHMSDDFLAMFRAADGRRAMTVTRDMFGGVTFAVGDEYLTIDRDEAAELARAILDREGCRSREV